MPVPPLDAIDPPKTALTFEAMVSVLLAVVVLLMILSLAAVPVEKRPTTLMLRPLISNSARPVALRALSVNEPPEGSTLLLPSLTSVPPVLLLLMVVLPIQALVELLRVNVERPVAEL